MHVKNAASFTVIANCTLLDLSSGGDTLIPPGHLTEVLGPYIGEIGTRPFYAVLTGVVTCHDDPNKNFFRVEPGCPACIQHARGLLTIRHHLDKEVCVLENNDPAQQ